MSRAGNASGFADATGLFGSAALRRPAVPFLAFVLGYFLVQTLLRVLYAPSVGLDEAEILVTSQYATWGQGSQPPLYNWLQIAAFHLFGTNLFALAIVKNALLAVSFLSLFLCGRLCFQDDGKAAAAALCLFIEPQIGWESQRALTHSVVAIAMVAVTCLALLRVLRSGKMLDYALLGLCVGLGGMSKYNYFIALAAMLAAALSVRALRQRILSLRIAVSAAVAGLVLLPHALWLLDNSARAMSRTQKFEAKAEAAFSMEPILTVAGAALAACALPLVVFALAGGVRWWSRGRPSPGPFSAERRFLLRIVPAGLLIVAAAAFLAGVTEVRERWLVTVTLFAPLALFILLEQVLGPRQQRAIVSICLLCAALAMAGLAGLHLLPDLADDPPQANRPFPALAEGIRQDGFTQGVLLAGDTRLAGALKLEFPDSLVLEPQYGALAQPAEGAATRAVWRDGEEPPQPLLDLAAHGCGLPAISSAPRILAAPFVHSKKMFAIRVADMGPCRGPRALASLSTTSR